MINKIEKIIYSIFMVCGWLFVIFLINILINSKLQNNKNNTEILQETSLSKEVLADQISTTLLQTYPYLNIWGEEIVYYWSYIIIDQSIKLNLDWKVICAKIHCESSFNPRALSDMNAKGMSQLLDSTAAITARKMKLPYNGDITIWTDVSNILLGINYLNKGIKREGSIDNGLRCYYAGKGWRKNKNQEKINIYVKTVNKEIKKLDLKYKELFNESINM